MKTNKWFRFFNLFITILVLFCLSAAQPVKNVESESRSAALGPTISIVGAITFTGFQPRAMALDTSTDLLYIYDQSTKKVFIYDSNTLQQVGSIATTFDSAISMVIDESQQKLYLGYFGPGVIEGPNIAVIDTVAKKVTKYLNSTGYNLLVNDEAANVVYASHNGAVSQIDVTSDIMTPINGLSANIYTSMAVNPLTHELFVANWSQNNDNLYIVNATTLALTTVPNMAGFGVGINWLENKAYVTYCKSAGYEGVCIYDRDTGLTKSIHTENDSSAPLVFNPFVNRMYSDTEVNRMVTIFDGKTDEYKNILNMPMGLNGVGVRYSTDHVFYVGESVIYIVRGSTGETISHFNRIAIDPCNGCSSHVIVNQGLGRVFAIARDAEVIVIQDTTLDWRIYLPFLER